MKKIFTALLTFVLLLMLQAKAQQISIKGIITDQQGQPMPGVTIKIKSTGQSVSANGLGNYAVSAGDKDILIFSFVGFEEWQEAINYRKEINVTLVAKNKQLNEVVVVGYGTQKRKDITGAVSTVSKKDFENRLNTQLGSMLEGKAAGVQVVNSSGKPSAGLAIRIRGTSSISAGAAPLYVIDGVPSSDQRAINPDEIESISILKDASSAAIYGASGANGVVLITTKHGSGKPSVSVTAYNGGSKVWKKLDVLNADQYKALMTEMGYVTDFTKYPANTDWQNKVFQNGTSQNYQVAASGKTDKTSYYVSGGWIQQNGAVRSSTMDRYNFKVSLDQNVNNWLVVGANIAYSRWHDRDVNDNTNVSAGGVILGALTTPPILDVYNADGSFTNNPFQQWENPLAATDGSLRGYYYSRIFGNLYAEATLLPFLKFRSSLGTQNLTGKFDSFRDPYTTNSGRSNVGLGQSNIDLSNYWIAENTLTFSKKFNKHRFSALIGAVTQKTKTESSAITVKGYSGVAVTTVNAGATIVTATGSSAEKANSSFLSRINYDYAGKYLLTANFRADGSSAFGPDNRWGYFPSFSLGWRLSEENFMKSITVVNDLKIRGGWGQVGNDQIGNYAWVGLVGSGTNYPFGGVLLPGTNTSTIENKSLKWETTTQTNIGFDVSFFNSRISFSADAYLKNTADMLLNKPIPTATGFATAVQNVGKVQNKGLEFQLNTNNLVGKFKWSSNFNISFNRNKVIDIAGQTITGGTIPGRGDVNYNIQGQPLGVFYGYVSNGVDPNTGSIIYSDVNNDGVVNTLDRTIIGNPNPKFYYGFTNTFNYKGIGLNVFLQGSQGNQMFNASRIETEGLMNPTNQLSTVLRRWTTVGQITDIPKVTPNNSTNSYISSRFVENGSYLRVKSATLSYSMPSAVVSRLHITGIKFYVTGENLFTFTKYQGFDPEVNAGDASNTSQGVDYGTYPQTRNLIFGLNLTF